MLKQYQIDNHQANFRKLVILCWLNMPFVYSILLLAQKWDTPAEFFHRSKKKKDSLLKIFNGKFPSALEDIIQKILENEGKTLVAINKLNIEKSDKKELFEVAANKGVWFIEFENDIRKLLHCFHLDTPWEGSISTLVKTGYLSVPYSRKLKNIPPKSFCKKVVIFRFAIEYEAQKSITQALADSVHLSKKAMLNEFEKYGFSSSNAGVFWKSLGASDYFPSLEAIAYKVWGEECEKFGKLTLESRVRQQLHRIKKSQYYVSLTSEYKEKLHSLFNYSPK